ncbi:cactus-binding C-terminus of cactin protein-domain-containing protein [Yarrowia lipolytica]|uniref:Splicing factor Cactin n=2 Tax=Yarrowia lipolytica TaxID=4952 RepID=Q6CF65_YARLI|nr:YALI0B09889p [Yarrowia lipolytica CLIB122]AOW01480.1 hypothetical protein YALI1_B13290g [Yarrowia lipolytica]KAB8280153.1 cactus-binding C-terminus of cactin protein-domain-containing protein [Yarrowia lipolytica]KAE8169138.1 cactus-binding C-terminus of cactin protein-domain-containing protein [Yarrowia lipolytica]KAJ8052299.1 cactus-binding C-terminus of cactin protein-domain-containing protein [Yarrowia lipolytica]QNP96661.1 Hypothetical protein YALI2_C00314g [Yarrowia lipolytica]|eukprot:XP_500697.1 YALI0B09889p [Yarrowia lipolytica CLIB122]
MNRRRSRSPKRREGGSLRSRDDNREYDQHRDRRSRYPSAVEDRERQRSTRDNERTQTQPQRGGQRRDSQPDHEYGDEAQSRKWIEGEGAFLLKQKRMGSILRINQGRASSVDLFNLILMILERDSPANRNYPTYSIHDQEMMEGREAQIPSVETLLDGLKTSDQTQLSEMAKIDPENASYWGSALQSASNRDSQDSSKLSVVRDDIEKVLGGKNREQLADLEARMQKMIDSGAAPNREFFQDLVAHSKDRRMRLVLDEKRSEAIETRYKQLCKEAGTTPQTPFTEELYVKAVEQYNVEWDKRKPQQKSAASEKTPAAPDFQNAVDDGMADGLLPQITDADGVIDLSKGITDESSRDTEEAELYQQSDEIKVDKKTRPRFHNRVVLGFDWNKYNQTHYDSNNLPPKTVQGYKFNIFYPELPEGKTPSYQVIKMKNEDITKQRETCLLKFTAPAPYADLTFRVVDRTWDYAARGDGKYNSSYHNGVLQLHFRFKKDFYKK